MGLGRREGKQQLRPQPSSWVSACTSLPLPGTPPPPVLGCQTMHGLSAQPTSGNKARQPGIFLSLHPHLTLVKLGCRTASRGSDPWEGDLSVHRAPSRSTLHGTRKQLPTGAMILAPARIPSPGFVQCPIPCNSFAPSGQQPWLRPLSGRYAGEVGSLHEPGSLDSLLSITSTDLPK